MSKVSVIMPVFNGEQYILGSINSVLNQSLDDLELIVVNDGSTDRTLEIVELLKKNDPRIKIIDRSNSDRPSFPKNEGIAVASGEYICFLDHDDLYDVDRITQLVAGLEDHPDWIAVFHDTRYINSQGEQLTNIYLKDHDFLNRAKAYLTPISNDWFECSESFYVYQSLVTGAMHTSTVLIAVNRLPKGVVKFDTQFTICDDTDLWIRLGMHGKIGYLNKVLSSYRQHQTSITRNAEKLMLDTLLLHKHNYQRVKDLVTQDQEKQLRARIASCIEDIAYLRFQQYRLREARGHYRDAFSWHPRANTLISLIKTFVPESALRLLKERM